MGIKKLHSTPLKPRGTFLVTPAGCSRCSPHSPLSKQQHVRGIGGLVSVAAIKWEFGHLGHPPPGVFGYFTEEGKENCDGLVIQSLTQTLMAQVGVLPAASVVLQRPPGFGEEGELPRERASVTSAPRLLPAGLGGQGQPGTSLLGTPTRSCGR